MEHTRKTTVTEQIILSLEEVEVAVAQYVEMRLRMISPGLENPQVSLSSNSYGDCTGAVVQFSSARLEDVE